MTSMRAARPDRAAPRAADRRRRARSRSRSAPAATPPTTTRWPRSPQLGFVYDSSHNGADAPWPSQIGLPPRADRAGRARGVDRGAGDGDRGSRRARCAPSRSARCPPRRCATRSTMPPRNDHAAVTIVSHGFELANRAGTRANAVHVRRFERAVRDARRRAATRCRPRISPIARRWRSTATIAPLGPSLLRTALAPGRAALVQPGRGTRGVTQALTVAAAAAASRSARARCCRSRAGWSASRCRSTTCWRAALPAAAAARRDARRLSRHLAARGAARHDRRTARLLRASSASATPATMST